MAMFSAELSSRRGPLPEAAEFNAYSEKVEDGSERILKMAEEAQAAKIRSVERTQDLDELAITGGLGAIKRADYMALVIALASLIIAAVLAILERDVAAGILGVSGVATAATLKAIFGRGGRDESQPPT